MSFTFRNDEAILKFHKIVITLEYRGQFLEMSIFFYKRPLARASLLINPRSRTEHQAAKPTAFWKLTREIKIKNEIQTRVDGINKGSGETDELRGGGNPEN